MANRRNGSDAREAARSRLASFLLVLLPGFMFLGLLAPAAVTVEYKGPEQKVVAETLRDFPLPMRRPMIAISDATREATQELTAIRDFLAEGTRLIARGAKQALRLPEVQDDADSDDIVLGEDQPQPAERDLVNELFDSTAAREPGLVAVLEPLWNRARFGKISGPLDFNGDRMWDDFPGEEVVIRSPAPAPVQVVPEPRSAALVALGLLGIGVHRRRTH